MTTCPPSSENQLLGEEPHKLLVVQLVVVVSVHLADQLLHLDKEEVTLHLSWTNKEAWQAD